MKKIPFFFSIVFILLNSCTNGQQNKSNDGVNTEAVVENVSAAQMKDLIQKHPEGIILDVRTSQEVANGHLANASVIDFYDGSFLNKAGMIRKDVPLFIYCAAGSRSAKAAEDLSKMGFKKIYNLQGGFSAWRNAGFEVVTDENNTTPVIPAVSREELDEIVKTNKVVMLDFHTTWCIPCKKMAPVIDELVKEYSGKAVIKSIDADAAKDLAQLYKVEAVPTFIFLKDGKEVARKMGLTAKEEMVAAFDNALK